MKKILLADTSHAALLKIKEQLGVFVSFHISKLKYHLPGPAEPGSEQHRGIEGPSVHRILKRTIREENPLR